MIAQQGGVDIPAANFQITSVDEPALVAGQVVDEETDGTGDRA